MAKTRKGRTISVDMTDVEGPSKLEDGKYKVTVDAVTEEEGQDSGKPYLQWKLKTEAGKTLFHTTSLQPQALFNLRSTLEAVGVEVPAKELDIDLDDLVGREMMVSVQNEEYQGKDRPRVIDVFPLGGEEEEEDDRPRKKKARDEEEEEEEQPKKKKRQAEEEEEEEESPRKKRRRSPEDEEEEEPSFKVKQRVKFKDGKTTLSGTIVEIDEKEGFARVKVGKEEWDVELEELKADDE